MSTAEITSAIFRAKKVLANMANTPENKSVIAQLELQIAELEKQLCPN